ncbi:MAG: sensor histidine kinase [Caulobacteraceae bacterium]
MSQAQAATDLEQTPLPLPRGLDAEAKRSFLRMISHELRTPLNSIIGFSDVLRQQPNGPLAPEYLEYAAIIGDSGAKMLRMVNQIVEIVRLESQAADFDIHPEPLESLVEELLLGLRQEARTLNVRLAAEDLEAMPWVLADPKAVKTVLGNLLHNAMAHAPDGDVVTVRARRDGRSVVIEVEDHGPGADSADVARLLRPFEKGRTHGRGPDGAGLGLPIALLYSRAMGGDLDIRTEQGQGFTAVVTLPAA